MRIHNSTIGRFILGVCLSTWVSLVWTGGASAQLPAKPPPVDPRVDVPISDPLPEQSPTSLPSPWTSLDIGDGFVTGNASHGAGTFEIAGAGRTIRIVGSRVEAGHFAYVPLRGNGSITARLASQSGASTVAMAGVMVRSSLDDLSGYAMIGQSAYGMPYCRFRSYYGGSIYAQSLSGPAEPWIRVERAYRTLILSNSPDGVTWMARRSVSLNLGEEVQIGLYVTSGAEGVLHTASFDSVALEGDWLPPAPPRADAGPDQVVEHRSMPGVEPVRLNGSDSSDPDGTITAYTWYDESSGPLPIATGASPTVNLSEGVHQIRLVVTDADGLSDTDTVQVTVLEATAPVARDDAYLTAEDSDVLASVANGPLANDSNSTGNPMRVAIVSYPGHGVLTDFSENGSFRYHPFRGFNGTDSFTYSAVDSLTELASTPATVVFTVTAVPDAPVARGDAYTSTRDVSLSIPPPGVLGNDFDDEGDQLRAVIEAAPTHGALTLADDGSFVYSPDKGWYGIDSFTYTARSAEAPTTSYPATVSITVDSGYKDPGDDLTQPNSPRVTVSGVTIDQIDLSWQEPWDNIGIAHYLVYRDGAYITSVTGLSVSDAGRTPGTPCTYTVKAVDVAGNESLASHPVVATASSVTFTDIGAALPGVHHCSLAWGDYDGDGDLDLAVAGATDAAPIAVVCRNDGGGAFTTAETLVGLESASMAWGDFDRDGLLDLALAGAVDSSTGRVLVYRNSGIGLEAAPIVVDTKLRGSVAWGDCDNDGDLDLAVVSNDSGVESGVYVNDDGSLTRRDDGLPWYINNRSVAWGDYDNDSILDLVIVGCSSSGSGCRVYRNDLAAFTDVAAAVAGYYNGTAAWGDRDNDGDLDMAVGGSCYPESQLFRIYDNNAGAFADIGGAMPLSGSGCSLAWGDCDSDGALDLAIVSDWSADGVVLKSCGTAMADIGAGLTGVYQGSVAWGDYDNDGDLDVAVAGLTYGGPSVTRIYRADSVVANTPPSAPSDVQARLSGSGAGPYTLTITWEDAVDAETPSAGLSYAVRVGTSSGGIDIVSPMSDPETGSRRVPARGPIQPTVGGSANEFTLLLDEIDLYYCSVQAIDTSFAASNWANEPTTTDDANGRPEIALTVSTTDGFTPLEVEFSASGTTDRESDEMTYTWDFGDGNVGTGATPTHTYTSAGSFAVTLVVTDTGGGISEATVDVVAVVGPVFEDITPTPHPDGWQPVGNYGAVSWADYNSDGRLDLLMGGSNGFSYSTVLYRGNGSTFERAELWDCYGPPEETDSPAIELRVCADGGETHPMQNASFEWRDYDADGDLDIAFAGYMHDGVGAVSGILENVGVFHDAYQFVNIDAGLQGASCGHAAWGDYDNDGRPDIIVGGFTSAYSSERDPGMKLYRNAGQGAFTPTGILPGAAGRCTFHWIDVDNDGDLDLSLTNLASLTVDGFRWDLFTNQGDGSFAHRATCDAGQGVAWADFDADGDLDFATAGGITDRYAAQVFRNDGTGSFSEVPAGLTPVSGGSVAWGDFNNDGYPDLVVAGEKADETKATTLYSNAQGTGAFCAAAAELPGVTGCRWPSWGDFDDDGDLDLVIAGSGSSAPEAYLYRNGTNLGNQLPTPPTGLSAVVNGRDVTFAWLRATDAETPQPGLTYNLTIPHLMPSASSSTGKRLIPSMGNVQHNTSWKLKNLAPGIYNWRVQAVDSVFAGSAWADGGIFTIE